MTQITPYPVRLPLEMRQALQKSAELGGRSLQQEILMRLQASIDQQSRMDDLSSLMIEVQELRQRLERLEKLVPQFQR